MKTKIGFTIIIFHLLLLLVFIACLANASNEDSEKDLCDRVREFIRSSRSARTADTLRKVSLWPNGILPFEIDKSLQKYRRYIYQALNEYHEHSCIIFKQLKQPNSTNTAYIRFINGHSCYTTDIGRNGSRPNIISLGPRCYRNMTAIIHQIGHALGFVHEHQRSDQGEHIVMNIDKVDGNQTTKQQFGNNSSNQDCNLTNYSVMECGNDAFAVKSLAFSKDREVTLSSGKKGEVTLSWPMEMYGLSKLDIFAVNVLYCEKINL